MYINGANTYQMEMSGPVGSVDPGGLQDYATAMLLGGNNLSPGASPSERTDLATLQQELAYFNSRGYTMAAALLNGFLGNQNGANYPNGNTNVFNTQAFQNEVMNSKDYRKQAYGACPSNPHSSEDNFC